LGFDFSVDDLEQLEDQDFIDPEAGEIKTD
jgi:hypothetical protein